MKIAICSDSAENQNIKQWLRELDETAMLYIFIYARQYQCYGRISDLEQTLRQQDFFRVHKSCLVNLHYICYIGVENIGLMYPGSGSMIHLPLSRRKREQIKEAVQLA